MTPDPTPPEDPKFSTVETVAVHCWLCARNFTVTVRRYESVVRCPDCHYLQGAGVSW